MATTGKEKRGTSPSNPLHTDTTQRRRSPNPSNRSSPDQKHDPSSEKQIPNYLKPTISSTVEPSKQHGKKQTSNDASQKPNLSRRRSFDKPPSPSRVKALTSPIPKEGNLRSSSFSARTTTLPKPHPERLSRTPKDAGKPHSLVTRPSSGKKPSTTIKKGNSASSSSKTTDSSPGSSNVTTAADMADTEKLELHQEDQELQATEAGEELLHSGTPGEILKLEDKEHLDVIHAEDKGLKEFPAVSEDQDASLGVQMEQPDAGIHVEETGNSHHKVEGNNDKAEANNGKPEESYTTESKLQGEGKEGEENTTEPSAEKMVDEKDEVNEEGEGLESNDTDEVDKVVQEVKPEESTVPKSQGKKDSAAYNDVIEETATKLREQSKNKVLALAGAFETVISLQEPK